MEEENQNQSNSSHKKKKKRKTIFGPNLNLTLPPPQLSLTNPLTESGSVDGDLLVNGDGVRVLSQHRTETSPLIKPSDNQLSLDDFDWIKVIGQGNGGIVRLVQHKWTGQFFALKVITQTCIEEPTRRLIERELKINQFSHCSNVVVFYQSFYDRNSVSLILEYMDGGSLADLMKKVRMVPEPYLAAICKQVLKGLLYLHHEKHVIHRDIKPSNLLINHRGEVKITDFGVSVILTSTSGLANTVVGTYAYMSPERIGGSQPYGFKSDIWSLGLVLIECATGDFPYKPPREEVWSDRFELIYAIVNQPPPQPPPDIFSPELYSFISACVQKDSRDRQSANELMRHPFISMYDDMDIDLATYFTAVGSPLATL